MKKIMLALAVALIAGFAQAASVKWSTGGYSNGFTDENGNSLAGSTLYTVTATLWDSTGTTQLDQQVVDTPTGGGAYQGTFSYAATASTAYMFSAVIAKKDGTASWEMDKAAFSTPASGTKTLNVTTGASFATTGSKWASGGWQTTPEPTSGILLLMGAGLLGLRRKRA